MVMNNDKEHALITALNNIMQFQKDSVDCLERHIANVHDIRLQDLFKKLVFSRKTMLHEIQAELIMRGIDKAATGTLLGKAHMLFENIKSMITKGDALAITKEIRRGESMLIDYYKNALAIEIPADLRAKLLTHLAQIEDDMKEYDLLSVA
jgi:uncharacterized protein (TIGR02284 family)